MHNAAPFIAQTLDSIAQQSLDCVREIIVVDDASTDDSREVVTSYPDHRIRLLPLLSNQGVSVARETGLKQAKHEWVAFNDADDVWLDDKLERQFALLRAYPDAIGCVGGNGRLHRDGRRQWAARFGRWAWRPEENPAPVSPPYFRPVLEGHVYIQSLLVRREIAVAENFKPELRLMQDQDYFLRLGRHGTFVCTDRPVFLYRLSFSNTTAHGRMRAREFLANRDYLYLATDAFLRNRPGPAIAEFLQNHEPKVADLLEFETAQRFRHFNTVWVNRGLGAALVSLSIMLAKHPIQSSKFILQRVRHWLGR
jgi:glycosyltransferase involved in cell wall biosynthesis